MTTAPSDPVADAIRYLADQLTSALDAYAQQQQSMQATMLERMLAARDPDEPPP